MTESVSLSQDRSDGASDAGSPKVDLLVTHATANLAQCDHVVFMAEGRVVFFGPPREALAFFHVTTGDLADVYGRLEGEADRTWPDVAVAIGV